MEFVILADNKSKGLILKSNESEFKPIIEYKGVDYDFSTGLKDPHGNQISYSLWNDCNVLLAQGKIEFEKHISRSAKSENTRDAPKSKEEPEPVETARKNANAQTARKTALSALETLLAESVQQINTEEILNEIKPRIDEYVKTTYGNLPKIVHVKTDNGETRKVKGITHAKFEEILQVVNTGENVFLTGPAGCGKNVICKQVAEALGLNFYFSNAVTQEYKLTGFIDGYGKYHSTEFRTAFEKGGLFMLDEMDASIPEVLVMLNSALANGYFNFPDVGLVNMHPNFHCVAAGNTFGTGADSQYTGRFQLDAASLNRFFIVNVDYDENIEKSVAGNDEEILGFIHDFRAALKATSINHVVSYRNISRLYKLKDILEPVELVRGAVCGNLTPEDLRYISLNLKGETKYHKAVKTLSRK